MFKLLVVADDFTGALDTGAQFSSYGISTRVMIADNIPEIHEDPQSVLIIDAETRHLSGEQAYKIVHRICKQAVDLGIPYIFKKTDSALRGNIGSELTALYDAAGKTDVSFIPAWPKMGRTVNEGHLFIHGIPVVESVFGKDPFEPVKNNYIPDIIKEQSEIPVKLSVQPVDEGMKLSAGESPKGIQVFDGMTDEDMFRHASTLYEHNMLNAMAGCAGLAAVLPNILPLHAESVLNYEFAPGLFVVCGSVNPVTRQQIEYAENQGFVHFSVMGRQMLDQSYWQTPEGECQLDAWADVLRENDKCIISTDYNEKETVGRYAKELGMDTGMIRERIADNMGYILKKLLDRGVMRTIMVTGGDTLLGFMNQTGNNELDILNELEPGCVLSQAQYNSQIYHIISKAGGFGDKHLICRLAEKLEGGEECCRRIV